MSKRYLPITFTAKKFRRMNPVRNRGHGFNRSCIINVLYKDKIFTGLIFSRVRLTATCF